MGTIEKAAGDERGLVGKNERSIVLTDREPGTG